MSEKEKAPNRKKVTNVDVALAILGGGVVVGAAAVPVMKLADFLGITLLHFIP